MSWVKELIKLFGALVLWTSAFFYHSDLTRSEIIHRHGLADLQTTAINSDTIYFASSGEGKDTILLLHGTSSFMQTWDDWVDGLEEDYHVVRPDLLGFGLTGMPHNMDFSIENYLNSLFGLMDSLKIKSFHVAGNSFGGYLASEMALRHPDRVKSLCILNGSGFQLDSVVSKRSGFSLASMPVVKDLMRYITPKFVVKSSLKSFYGKPTDVTDEIVQRYFDYLLCENNRKSLVLKSAEEFPNLNHRLRHISCKSLLLWGENDPLIPLVNGRKMALSIPDAKLVVFPKTGHLPMEESPVESLGVYREFLRQIQSAQHKNE
jgi:pimeloyl-ACP methyl ester carboxylesterase